MFVNRLIKNARHRRKLAARWGTQAWRAYDRDIPEWPLVVDVYANNAHVRADEGAPMLDVDQLASAVAQGLSIPQRDVWIKVRRRLRRSGGPSQYERVSDERREVIVHEGGVELVVNLSDYFDAGLFVDHRPSRQWVGRISAGCDVLNLFCYTGAFSVHAAKGGARSTTSVDLSSTYLAWTERNLAHNGISVGTSHSTVRDDAMAYLHFEGLRGGRYDVAIVDPPTYSVSSRLGRPFDVRRDHAELLSRVGRLLRAGGVMLFSTNSRRFRLEVDALEGWRHHEITHWSVPEDCVRNSPHRSWLLWRQGEVPKWAPPCSSVHW